MKFNQRDCLWLTVVGVLTAIGKLVDSTVAQEPPGVVGRFGTLEYRTAGWCAAAALSPDGKVIAVAGAQTIGLTDLASGKPVGEFAAKDVILLSFSEEGKTLVSVREQGMVRYWSREKGSEARQAWQAFLPEPKLYDADFQAVLSPGGNLLLTLDKENVNVWDLNEQKRLRSFKIQAKSGPYALAPDGKTVATFPGSGTENLVILDAETGKPIVATDKFEGYRIGIRFSPDGKWLATCGSGFVDYRAWDTKTLSQQCAVARPNRDQHLMTFSPDGKLFFSTHGDGSLRLPDVATNKELWHVSHIIAGDWKTLQRAFFTPDQKRIISVEHDTIRIWDAATGRDLTADKLRKP